MKKVKNAFQGIFVLQSNGITNIKNLVSESVTNTLRSKSSFLLLNKYVKRNNKIEYLKTGVLLCASSLHHKNEAAMLILKTNINLLSD